MTRPAHCRCLISLLYAVSAVRLSLIPFLAVYCNASTNPAFALAPDWPELFSLFCPLSSPPAMLDPSATLHSRFVTAVQNAPYTHVFCLTFLALLLLTGAIAPLALAFLLALLVSFAYQMLSLAPQPVSGQLAVLITGAGTGLGFDMAVRLAGLGVTVYAGVWEAAEGTRLVEAAGSGKVVPLVLDVTKQQHVDAALATISSQVGPGKQRLYGLISNAGYGEHAPIELLSLDRLRANFEVNAFAVVRLTQSFLPLLRQGASQPSPSHIVITSSMNGRLTVAGKTGYCASKHALEAIGDNLRCELHRSHVRTTIIEPGFFPTGIVEAGIARASSIMKEAESDSSVRQRVPSSVLAHYRHAMNNPPKPIVKQPVAHVTDAVVQSLFRPETPSRLLVGWEAMLTGALEMLPQRYMDRIAAKAWL